MTLFSKPDQNQLPMVRLSPFESSHYQLNPLSQWVFGPNFRFLFFYFLTKYYVCYIYYFRLHSLFISCSIFYFGLAIYTSKLLGSVEFSDRPIIRNCIMDCSAAEKRKNRLTFYGNAVA